MSPFARRPRTITRSMATRRAEQTLLALVEEPAQAEPPRRDEPVTGCGWFDSSDDLRRGCAVIEHESWQAAAGELPLDEWLRLHLAGWAPSAAVPSTAQR